MDDDLLRIVAALLGGGVLAGGGSAALTKVVLNGIKEDISSMRTHLQKVDRRLSRIEGRQDAGEREREP